MGLSYGELFAAFFPFSFLILPVRIVALWDEDDGAMWLAGEVTEDMLPLDDGVEEFSPMPGFD